ncbi:branched-chain amino acid ABC transporter permease [Sinomonas sp. G460-2]|uniref:branched-chain amino acid ABC transporter permease n=1 Tax=Sinomonas sp. G460-2 TaxID=3393464 RepID=UPI0039F0706F
MTALLENLLLGVLLGGVYALLASGMTLVFGIMRVINLAQGALIMVSAFLTWTLWNSLHLDPLLATVIVGPVMFAVGYALYFALVRRVAEAPLATSILLTLGLALVLESAMGMIWSNTTHSVLPDYATQSFEFEGLLLPRVYVYASVLAVAVLAALYIYLSRSWQGRAIRACALNASGARLVGVNVVSVSALAFGIGAASAGVGGSIVSVLYPFLPASHYQWIARLLAVVVLGGLGSIPGALVASLLVGAAETLTSAYLSPAWATAMPFLVIFVVLLLRPQGLFGKTLRSDAVMV